MEFYTPQQLADLWGISVNTLRKWRWEGKGPQFVKLGRRVVYRKCDVEAYTNSNIFASTTDFTVNASAQG